MRRTPLFDRLGLLFSALLFFVAAEIPLQAGDAAADWAALIALDAGPTARPKTESEAHSVTLSHLDAQERALRGFLAAHPGDPHTFEARLRLARLLQIAADFRDSSKARTESGKIMDDLAKAQLTPEQRTELDFSRVSAQMRALKNVTQQQSMDLKDAAQRFAALHPSDRRIAALYAEVATLFDTYPKLKRELVEAALPRATDEELKARLTDDLKRLDLLGTEISMKFDAGTGPHTDLAALRGKVVLILFFADWSPPSVQAIPPLVKAVARFPKEKVQCVAVSLDQAPAAGEAVLRKAGAAWPMACDGKAWAGELVRKYGINSLPTVWLLDRKGHLRSLNGMGSTEGQINQLLGER